MTTVELSNGTELEFPDEMTQDQIHAAIQSHFGQPTSSIPVQEKTEPELAPYGHSAIGRSLSGLADFARGFGNTFAINPINFIAGHEILHPYQSELKGEPGQAASQGTGELLGMLLGPGKLTDLTQAARIPALAKTGLNIGGNALLGAAESPGDRQQGALAGAAGGALGELLQPITRGIASYLGGKTTGHLIEKAQDLLNKSYGKETYPEAFGVAKQQAAEFGTLEKMAKNADAVGSLDSSAYKNELENISNSLKGKMGNPAYNRVFAALDHLKNRLPNSFESALNLHEELGDLPKSWSPKETQANQTANKILQGISGRLKGALKDSMQYSAKNNQEGQYFNTQLSQKLKEYSRYKFLNRATQEGQFNPVDALKNYMNMSDSQKNIFSPEEKSLFDSASKAQTIKDKQKWLNKLEATFAKFPHWAGTAGKMALGGILGEMVGHPLVGASIPFGIGAAGYLGSKSLANPKAVELLEKVSQKNYPNKTARSISQALAYPFYSEQGSK